MLGVHLSLFCNTILEADAADSTAFLMPSLSVELFVSELGEPESGGGFSES